jgi:hypothetical protein
MIPIKLFTYRKGREMEVYTNIEVPKTYLRILEWKHLPRERSAKWVSTRGMNARNADQMMEESLTCGAGMSTSAPAAPITGSK